MYKRCILKNLLGIRKLKTYLWTYVKYFMLILLEPALLQPTEYAFHLHLPIGRVPANHKTQPLEFAFHKICAKLKRNEICSLSKLREHFARWGRGVVYKNGGNCSQENPSLLTNLTRCICITDNTARIAFFFVNHVADTEAVYSVSNSTEAQFMVLDWGDEVD